MNEHTAPGLYGSDQNYTEEIGREPGPGMIINGQHASIQVPVHLIHILRWNVKIIVQIIHLYAKLLKLFRNDADIIQPCVFNNNVTLRHSSQADKRTNLDHVRQHAVLGAAQVIHPVDSQQVTADPFDLCSHFSEHFTKLLDVRFASSIVNVSFANRHDTRHDQVSSPGNRRLIHQ